MRCQKGGMYYNLSEWGKKFEAFSIEKGRERIE